MIVGKNPNHSDNNQSLATLLETARKCNVRLNYEKLQYKKQEVDFLVKYAPQVVTSLIRTKSAITKMPAPTNKKQVQSFIGMINYLSNFSAWLSEIVEPIRGLAKDKVPFNWGPEYQSAFTQMKQEIVSAPILANYNPKKQTVLQTDASIKGLDACLLQEESMQAISIWKLIRSL